MVAFASTLVAGMAACGGGESSRAPSDGTPEPVASGSARNASGGSIDTPERNVMCPHVPCGDAGTDASLDEAAHRGE
jgi:hypothetical protein